MMLTGLSDFCVLITFFISANVELSMRAFLPAITSLVREINIVCIFYFSVITLQTLNGNML